MSTRTVAALMLSASLGALLSQAHLSARAAPGEVVRASALVLVDQQGRIRAELGMEGGEPTLRFLDEERRPRAVLGLAGGSPSLRLLGRPPRRQGPARKSAPVLLELGLADGGQAGMTLRDAAGHERFRIVVRQEETRLLLTDLQGDARVSLATGPGSHGLELAEQGQRRLWLGLQKTGPGLSSWDERGARLARWPVSPGSGPQRLDHE